MFSIFRRKKTTGEPDRIDYIIACLGNPGTRYETTRHNAGFLAADLLAEKLGAGRINRVKCKATYAICLHEGKTLLIMKPQTFMNLSGRSIGAAADFYKIDPAHVIVLCDDVTQSPGKVRIRPSGSAGGHNGL